MQTLRHTRKHRGFSTQEAHMMLLGLEAITSLLPTSVTRHALVTTFSHLFLYFLAYFPYDCSDSV